MSNKEDLIMAIQIIEQMTIPFAENNPLLTKREKMLEIGELKEQLVDLRRELKTAPSRGTILAK
jgi:hypothetical protein